MAQSPPTELEPCVTKHVGKKQQKQQQTNKTDPKQNKTKQKQNKTKQNKTNKQTKKQEQEQNNKQTNNNNNREKLMQLTQNKETRARNSFHNNSPKNYSKKNLSCFREKARTNPQTSRLFCHFLKLIHN